jgi:hypothetical protein
MFLHITEAKYIEDYRVEVSFDNGCKGIVDLSDVLKGTVFEPLRDKKRFSQLKIDPELETIAWPNGADLAPEYVFFRAFKDEPKYQDQFQAWGYVER